MESGIHVERWDGKQVKKCLELSGLLRVGGNVDEGARAVLGEGLFQFGDGFDQAVVAHAVPGERVRSV